MEIWILTINLETELSTRKHKYQFEKLEVELES